MKDVSYGGRTVLFVSHNMGAVKSLCSEALWSKKGKLFQQGNVKKTVENYLGSTEIKTTIKCEGPLKKLVKIENAIIRKNETEPCSVASRTDALIIQVTYEAGEDLEAFEAFCGIDGQSVRVFSIPSKTEEKIFKRVRKASLFEFQKTSFDPERTFLGLAEIVKMGITGFGQTRSWH